MKPEKGTVIMEQQRNPYIYSTAAAGVVLLSSHSHSHSHCAHFVIRFVWGDGGGSTFIFKVTYHSARWQFEYIRPSFDLNSILFFISFLLGFHKIFLLKTGRLLVLLLYTWVARFNLHQRILCPISFDTAKTGSTPSSQIQWELVQYIF